MRGEGHLRGLFRVVSGDDRVRMVVKEREERTKTNRDGIDVRLKLRYPSKITFDTASYWSDNKIKI
jgi:hypothetical protein